MGRPRATLKTLQITAFCRSVLEDPEYRTAVLQRARAGTLGSMEQVLYAYAYGRPKEAVEVRVGRIEDDFAQMSYDELALKAAELMRQLTEAAQLRRELDGYAIDASNHALTVVMEPEVEK